MERVLVVSCLIAGTCCLTACQQEDATVVQVIQRSQETRAVMSTPGYEGWYQQADDEEEPDTTNDDDSTPLPPKFGEEQDPDRDLEDASDSSDD